MKKWIFAAVAVILAGAAEAAMSDAQCESFLRRMQAGESVYVGPAERECIRRSMIEPPPAPPPALDSAEPAKRDDFVQADSDGEDAVENAAEPHFSLAESNQIEPFVDPQPAPGEIFQKIYDLSPFERKFEAVLPDLLHHDNSEAVFIEGAGQVMVRDDSVGHANIEKALAAYRDRYMVSYELMVEKKQWGAWPGSASSEMVAAGQISPVTSPQHLGGFVFSLRHEGGQAILDVRGAKEPMPVSLIFPPEGGTAQYMSAGCVYRVRLNR